MTVEELQVVISAKTAGFQQQMAGVQRQMSNLEAASGRVTSKLSSMFAGIGKAAVAAFSVQTIINFGKQAISLASDLQEVENVVTTAFGDMSDEVDKWSKTTVDKFGMSELSAKRTASTYMAMSKGMGLAGEQAAEMAMKVAERTGDIASFYNMTQEEADTMLKSIWTGETESLKRIGVVMTQANLDAYALAKGMGKTTDEMSQAEQVMLRYQYVMEQTNLAAGDFEKTSGSWANQVRVLSERFKELLGILGTGLIQVLTPVIKVLNTLLGIIIKIVSFIGNVLNFLFGWLFGNDSGSSSSGAGQMETDITGAADAMEELDKNTEAVKETLKGTLAGFDELNVLTKGIFGVGEEDGSGSGSGSGTGSGSGDGTATGTPGLKPGDGSLQENPTLSQIINADKVEKEVERVEKALDRLIKHPITEWLKGDGAKAWDIYLEHTANWYTYVDDRRYIMDDLLESLKTHADRLADSADQMREQIWQVFPAYLEAIRQTALQLNAAFAVMASSLLLLQTAILLTQDRFGAFSAAATAQVVNMMLLFASLADYMGGNFSADWSASLSSAGGDISGWAAAAAAACSLVQKSFESVSNYMRSVWDGAHLPIQGFEGRLQRLVIFVSGSFMSTWRTAWEGVRTFFSWIWDGIWTIARFDINLIIDAVNFLWSAIYNVAYGVVTGVDWFVSGIGSLFGQDWDVSIPKEPPLIPKLATGGLAYGPTLAMIGEGNDREAVLPLNADVYGEIARGIQAAGGTGNRETIVLLEQILAAVDQIDPTMVMDGTTLARSSDKYFAAEQRRRGPSLVKVV